MHSYCQEYNKHKAHTQGNCIENMKKIIIFNQAKSIFPQTHMAWKCQIWAQKVTQRKSDLMQEWLINQCQEHNCLGCWLLVQIWLPPHLLMIGCKHIPHFLWSWVVKLPAWSGYGQFLVRIGFFSESWLIEFNRNTKNLFEQKLAHLKNFVIQDWHN